jgi:Flp pilus assembly protein TadD
VILNGLGALRARRGQFEEAEVLLTRAVELKRATLGHHHADVAVTLNNLGLVYKHRGDFARARETYRVAVEIFDECLGAEHPKTIACQMNHARCLADGALRTP